MSPVCHIESPPRRPGDSPHGKRPKLYPAGRVCVACPTELRRTNPGPWCDPCLNNAAKIRQKEEKVGKESLREAVLLAFARDPSRRFNAGDVVEASGVSPSCVYKNLKALAASGEIVRDAPGVYRWPTIEDATSSEGEESAKTAPDAPPAPAPVIPPPEQPANVAPASDPLPPQAGLAPFAGIDYELVVIGEVVRRIESLTGHETRVRVAAYVASRFL